MKRIAMWCLCWLLYMSGDAVSRVMHYGILGHLYPIYNWLMIKSVVVNDAYGFDFWSKPNNEETQCDP